MDPIIIDPAKDFPLDGKLYRDYTADDWAAHKTWKRRRALRRMFPYHRLPLVSGSIESHRELIIALTKLLGDERKRGTDGHWTYDLPRHGRLLAMYEAECVAYTEALKRIVSDEIANRAAQVAARIETKRNGAVS